MLPGVPKEIKNAEIDDKEINRIEAMICSMTPAERENPSVINGSRRVRIAQGSGVTPADVNALLKQFKMVQQMMKGMGGKGKGRFKLPPGINPEDLGDLGQLG
jgi:signal recognition particle subunit SRP54